MPGLQHAASLVVCLSPWPSIDPLDASRRTHAQQEQRILGLCFQSPAVLSKAMRPTSLPNVRRCGGIQHTGRSGVHHAVL